MDMFTACTALVKLCNLVDLSNQIVALGVKLESCIIP